MFEVRWLERETGNRLMYENGFYYAETVRVLQYRYKYSQAVYSYTLDSNPAEDRFETVWSEWTDVPTVKESK